MTRVRLAIHGYVSESKCIQAGHFGEKSDDGRFRRGYQKTGGRSQKEITYITPIVCWYKFISRNIDY